MTAALFSLIGVSFILSFILTAMMKRLAPRIGFVDKPGHRKIHLNPKPLGGGVAIVWAFVLPIAVGLVYVNLFAPPNSGNFAAKLVQYQTTDLVKSSAQQLLDPNLDLHDPIEAYWFGARQQTPLALAFIACCLALHAMGLWDDKKALGPSVKLFFQLAITLAVVLLGGLRILTALGNVPSIVLTVLWITAITNAFNFLDNMDGLSAGIAAVATTAFLVTAISIEQWFVAASLALLLGALIGFLCFNFAPASIFMGDSGSTVIGFILGVLTVRTTFLPADADFKKDWYATLAPVIVLAVPLYDLVVVSIIRISKGKSPFVGDTNHVSHRLVRRGMSKRTAVLCLWLLTAATAIGAVILPQVRTGFGAFLIGLQTLLVLGVVALLEQHPIPQPKQPDAP